MASNTELSLKDCGPWKHISSREYHKERMGGEDFWEYIWEWNIPAVLTNLHLCLSNPSCFPIPKLFYLI